MPKKKKKKSPHRKPSPVTMQVSEAALMKVAQFHGVSVEEVRKQIQIAMLNGLVNDQMGNVPSEGEIPTPEELIAYGAERVFEDTGSVHSP